MCNLEEYKENLIYKCRWGIDDTEEKRAKRRNLLTNYGDEHLETIIKNTEEFIYYLIDKMETENKAIDDNIYTLIELESDKATNYNNTLNLNLTGGWPSDTFFYIEKGKLISMSLLHKLFSNFRIECTCEETDVFNEVEQAGHIEEKCFFYISGSINRFNELKEKARNIKGKELINSLKRIRTNKAD